MSKDVRAKKHLGQHFLIDENIAFDIVKSIPENYTGNLLEIGPGTGVLTKYLLKEEKINFKAFDVDHESIEYLHKHYPQHANKIVLTDYLQQEESIFKGEHYGIIGNFPYNISSQIFFKVLETLGEVDFVVCMLQKEVAERIVSPPGSRDYGILSVLLQAYYSMEYLMTIPPHVFSPPPKVNSAVIRLTRNNVTQLGCDERTFKMVIKTAFNQRRKTLRNALKPIMNDVLAQSELLDKRAEELSVANYITIANIINAKSSE